MSIESEIRRAIRESEKIAAKAAGLNPGRDFGYILVHRRGYVARRGKTEYRVRPTTYRKKDIGAPGKGPKVIKIKRKGALIAVGYSVHAPEDVRRRALRKAVEKYGPTSVYRMLLAQAVFRKRTDGLEPKFRADAEWIKKEYGLGR